MYETAEVFLEAGDWLVWQLTTGPFPHCDVRKLVRSTCQAGYKAMWNRQSGYPSEDYFGAVDDIESSTHPHIEEFLKMDRVEIG